MDRKTFIELYKEQKMKPTPAQSFVAEVAELTHRSRATVRMWIIGKQVPDELAKSIIADRYSVDAEFLFNKQQQS